MARSIDQDFDTFQAEWDKSMKHAIETVDPRWSITGYKGHATRDGVAFVAKLRLDGKIVGHLEDSGRGGGVTIDFWGTDGENVRERKLWDAEVGRVLPDEGKYMGEEMLAEALLQKAGK
jgi:hypothetical protein